MERARSRVKKGPLQGVALMLPIKKPVASFIRRSQLDRHAVAVGSLVGVDVTELLQPDAFELL